MSGVNWTEVLVVGIPAWIAAVFAGLASLRAAKNGHALKTSNGHTIGEVVERTHDLAAVTMAEATGATGAAVTQAQERLASDPGLVEPAKGA